MFVGCEHSDLFVVYVFNAITHFHALNFVRFFFFFSEFEVLGLPQTTYTIQRNPTIDIHLHADFDGDGYLVKVNSFSP